MLNRRADKLELLRIAEAVALEKSIDKEIIIDSMETGIAKAAKSKFGSENEIKVLIDRDSGNIGIFRKLVIVEKPENFNTEINLQDAIVLSTQHDEDISYQELKDGVFNEIIKPIIPSEWITDETKILINPTGKFVIGGPVGDCGLTGRKIIVDTYGGAAPHGGGAFSGKDPTKVDRSAAYASRYLAKNVVASKIAEKCLIQLAYAIGVSKPLSIYVDLFDNDEEKNRHVQKLINENFDLTPRGIREMLGLNKPIYEKTAAYGHFGRDPESNGAFSWEKTDKADVFNK